MGIPSQSVQAVASALGIHQGVKKFWQRKSVYEKWGQKWGHDPLFTADLLV